jgi:hypothetical protein
MNKQMIAMILAVIGIIFFLSNTFQILASNIAMFGGVVFLLLSGLTWAFWPKK